MGLSGEVEGRLGQAARPLPLYSEFDKEGGGGPLSFLLSPSLPFPPPTPTRKRGSHTPGGSRTPPWRALPWPAASSPLVLYIRGQGAPLDTTIDLLIS